MRNLLVFALLALPAVPCAQTLPEQVLERVNIERWNNGQLPPLKGQANLDSVAAVHSQAMGQRNFFAHCDLDTLSSPWERMVVAGYSFNAAAENIAAGTSTAAGVMSLWMSSPGHRANILATHVREIGIGHHLGGGDGGNVRADQNGDCVADGPLEGPYFHYWTQNFGLRNNVMPLVIAREAWRVAQCQIDIHLYGSGWASQYRLSNDGSTWGPWQAFTANVLWPLSGPAGGTATVHGQIRNTAGTVRSAQDSVRLAIACGVADPIFANGFQP